jgi:hypothetical protein
MILTFWRANYLGIGRRQNRTPRHEQQIRKFQRQQPARRGAMKYSDPHARSKPAILERPRNLPADVMHAREVEWLGELRSRLAAVHAWRGFTTPQPSSSAVERTDTRA